MQTERRRRADVETARALSTLPKSLKVYGIEGVDFSAGDRLSPAVRETAEKLISRIAETLPKNS